MTTGVTYKHPYGVRIHNSTLSLYFKHIFSLKHQHVFLEAYMSDTTVSA